MYLPVKNNVILKTAIHVLIWLLLCIMPYMLSSSQAPEFNKIISYTWIPMVFYIVVFYINYFIIIDKLLFNKKLLWYICVNLVLLIAFTWSIFELKHFINEYFHIPKPPNIKPGISHRQSLKLFIYKDALSLLIPVIVSIAVKVTEQWTRTEIEKKEAVTENLNSELLHLKYQLQPHFFFNSLNNIYSLIEHSPVIAQEAVHSLAQLMRYMLYDADTGTTNLSQEIEFMAQYINLMKLRISDKTVVITEFPTLTKDHKIAPLLFISLIENAFKHGISATQSSELFFSLTVKENTVCFVAQNNNFPKTDNDKSGSGIGLNNIRKRLELLYPNNYVFKTKIEDSIFKVMLTIDLNTN